MDRRILLLLLLLFTTVSTAFAQRPDRYLQRMDRWYAQGKYDRIVRKAPIYIADHPNSPWGYAHAARAHLALADEARFSRTQVRHWHEALDQWKSVPPRARGLEIMPQTAMEIQFSLRSRVLEAHERQQKELAKEYTTYLAHYFADTVGIAYALMGWSRGARPTATTAISYLPAPKELPDWARNPKNPITIPNYLPPRDTLLAVAERLQGIPYKWAGEQPETGFDCSGFVLYVMRSQGYDFLHGTRYIKDLGWPIPANEARPGDLVFFGSRDAEGKPHVSHMGMIYRTGEGQRQVIHCPSRGVVIDDLNEGNYWTDRILFYRNVVDLQQ